MVNPVNDKAWDIGFHKEIGDESNPTYAIVIGGTSQALHVVDAAHAGTDFNVAADSNPSLYIHGSGAPVTEYVKVYTDQTDAWVKAVGANLKLDVPTGGSANVAVNGTVEYEFSATSLAMGSNTITGAGNIVLLASKSLIGTNLTINGGGTAFGFAAASYAAVGTGTITDAVLGPAEVGSVTCKGWFKIKADAAGTSIGYIPYYNA